MTNEIDWASRIEALRQAMIAADHADPDAPDRFSHLQRQFLSLIEHGRFLDMGRLAVPQPVRELVYRCVDRLTDGHGEVRGLVLIHIPQTTFTYGCFMVRGWLGSVFWFADPGQGLLSLGPIEGPTQLVRITAVPVARVQALGPAPAGEH